METKALPVAGLNDDAYMTQDMVQIHILRKSDVTIDARGDSKKRSEEGRGDGPLQPGIVILRG